MKNKKVAIVYSYIHHYRIPIFSLLSSFSEIEYTIYAGKNSEITIRKANTKLSSISPSSGGIRWVILKNIWIYKFILLQYQILKPSFFSKFDSIIFLGNMYYLSTWLSALISRIRGKKVIFWTHGYIREERNLKGLIRKLFYRIPHEILVYGERAKNILISKGFDESKIKIIYNSLDYDLQSKLVPNKLISSLFLNKKLPIVGFIGRLTKQKKVNLIIKVLNSIENKYKFNLLVVGDGEEKTVLKKLVESYNLSDFVVFKGSVYNEQLNCDLISSMDVVVSPGEVGLTAIHAMTYGTPVITHNRFEFQMPEFEAIIPEFSGEFFDYDNPIDSMISTIPKFYDNKNKYYKNCKKIIREKYNPNKQLLTFNNIV